MRKLDLVDVHLFFQLVDAIQVSDFHRLCFFGVASLVLLKGAEVVEEHHDRCLGKVEDLESADEVEALAVLGVHSVVDPGLDESGDLRQSDLPLRPQVAEQFSVVLLRLLVLL